MWSAIQEERVKLFELGDVVTWPVLLVDATAETGWPAHVGVETTVTVECSEPVSWAATASGLRVRTRLSGSAGASVPMRAALTVAAFLTRSYGLSYVTGTVRRIELASSPIPGRATRPSRSRLMSPGR